MRIAGVSTNVRKMAACCMAAALCLQACGCSVGLVVNKETSRELLNARRMDLAARSIIVEPNSFDVQYKAVIRAHMDSPTTTIDCDRFYRDWLHMLAVWTEAPGGKAYGALLDTGGGRLCLLTNGLTVTDCNMATYPLPARKGQPAAGLCELPWLRIGQAKIWYPPCSYIDQQWEVRILGLSLWRQKGFLAGLGLLEHFSYMEVDGPAGKVTLAGKEAFRPADANLWDCYAMELKVILGDRRLVVTMPVGDANVPVSFDTCGRNWLVVDANMLAVIRKDHPGDKLHKSGFMSGFVGDLPCSKVRVTDFRLANRIVRNDDIVVVPDGSPFPPNIVGMKYFFKTDIVLDFKGRTLWVKK
jgi:hypothetical protein